MNFKHETKEDFLKEKQRGPFHQSQVFSLRLTALSCSG